MKSPHWFVTVFSTLLAGAAGIQTAAAQLPSLDVQPWHGYFGVFENNRCQFNLASQGKAFILPMDAKGKPATGETSIQIYYGIEEVLPDGKTRMRTTIPASLESAEKPTEKFEKAVIRGKVAGDATFEVTFEQERGVISIGGRIIDPGTGTKNPLRFTVRAKIPNVYSREKKEDRKAIKAFEKKLKDDRLTLSWTDGKRLKKSPDEIVDVTSKEINGPGIASAELDISAYKGNKITFSASENSMIRLWNDKPAPLYAGYWVTWLADTAKDPEGKARFRIQVK